MGVADTADRERPVRVAAMDMVCRTKRNRYCTVDRERTTLEG
jgi:hypothetical protein